MWLFYYFIVSGFHRLLLAGLPALYEKLGHYSPMRKVAQYTALLALCLQAFAGWRRLQMCEDFSCGFNGIGKRLLLANGGRAHPLLFPRTDVVMRASEILEIHLPARHVIAADQP